MNRDEIEDVLVYKVVVNHEEQFSIWPAQKKNPIGWNDAGKSGPKRECLAYIKGVWTDMRPLSLKREMDQRQLHEVSSNPSDEFPLKRNSQSGLPR
jgi:MbtH protein